MSAGMYLLLQQTLKLSFSFVELETNAAVVAGQSNETKENCEKSKTPSRRNSRTEDSAASQETVENGQRKRSSRPASASGTAKGNMHSHPSWGQGSS